jgi:hypothetical protein
LAATVHYGLFHNPPRYVETDRPLTRVHLAARHRAIEFVLPQDGELVQHSDL